VQCHTWVFIDVIQRCERWYTTNLILCLVHHSVRVTKCMDVYNELTVPCTLLSI